MGIRKRIVPQGSLESGFHEQYLLAPIAGLSWHSELQTQDRSTLMRPDDEHEIAAGDKAGQLHDLRPCRKRPVMQSWTVRFTGIGVRQSEIRNLRHQPQE
ncbi:hypothetical protein J2Z31_001784 [Sinorhizobium kostiense]|uniref:Uncharacterized protein n=1 Tax=Sinorhizobium kostiense TaxID=76747 RepID=A0ABS4R0B8_9HYPH|nr:hypothetical protein [Sinorhizobium kostiense]MBP2235292.1 hypothetical protein [Sinorhizobium kostiense]